MIDITKIGVEEQTVLKEDRDYCFVIRDRDTNKIRKLKADEAKELLEMAWQYYDMANS